MTTRWRARVSWLLLGVAIAACGDNQLEPLPLDLTVSANRTTAAPGQAIEFVVDAQGGSLVGVNLDYGDGSDETFSTSGARTAHVTFHHTYQATGTFQVNATITDASAGQKSKAIEIRVQ